MRALAQRSVDCDEVARSLYEGASTAFMRSVDCDEVARSFYEGASTAFMRSVEVARRSVIRSLAACTIDNVRSP